MSDYETAYKLAKEGHGETLRLNGALYFTHPEAVVQNALAICKKLGIRNPAVLEKVKMIAIMHDLIEDEYPRYTLDLLVEYGFPNDVIRGVGSVTKRDGDTYIDLVERAKNDKLGIIVKIADITHNLSDLDRSKAKHMHDKYELALWILEQELYD
jgi:(p)ppGpp synthase/HD superfamily hydrolase